MIYAEGGGDTANQKAELRRGFDGLLEKWKSKSRAKRLSLRIVCAGGRNETFDAFINALHTNPNSINVLLVDSETHVTAYGGDATQDSGVRVAHLMQHDNWNLEETSSERVHLMAQCMETWLVADPAKLKTFYGKEFAGAALPSRPNLEEESKPDIYAKLAKATRNTQKGAYGKIKHASQLLQKIDPVKVANCCPRFALLTNWLDTTIEAN